MLVTESCVVALETSCGRDGARAIECDDVGRDEKAGMPSCGRGGSGGGVPSLDGEETPLYEGLRDALPIMLNVGLAKSCGCTQSASCGASSIAGEADLSSASLGGGWLGGSAFPVSDMERIVWDCHEVWVEL